VLDHLGRAVVADVVALGRLELGKAQTVLDQIRSLVRRATDAGRSAVSALGGPDRARALLARLGLSESESRRLVRYGRNEELWREKLATVARRYDLLDRKLQGATSSDKDAYGVFQDHRHLVSRYRATGYLREGSVTMVAAYRKLGHGRLLSSIVEQNQRAYSDIALPLAALGPAPVKVVAKALNMGQALWDGNAARTRSELLGVAAALGLTSRETRHAAAKAARIASRDTVLTAVEVLTGLPLVVTERLDPAHPASQSPPRSCVDPAHLF
jgi:hypothetical protein